MLPRPMREFIWTDVMYNPNVEREKKGRHSKKARDKIHCSIKLTVILGYCDK